MTCIVLTAFDYVFTFFFLIILAFLILAYYFDISTGSNHIYHKYGI